MSLGLVTVVIYDDGNLFLVKKTNFIFSYHVLWGVVMFNVQTYHLIFLIQLFLELRLWQFDDHVPKQSQMNDWPLVAVYRFMCNYFPMIGRFVRNRNVQCIDFWFISVNWSNCDCLVDILRNTLAWSGYNSERYLHMLGGFEKLGGLEGTRVRKGNFIDVAGILKIDRTDQDKIQNHALLLNMQLQLSCE